MKIEEVFERIKQEWKDTDIEEYIENTTSNTLDDIMNHDIFKDIFKEFSDNNPQHLNTNRVLSTQNMKITCVECGGCHHDGGEIYEVFKVEFLNTKEEYYFQYIGEYSSWDTDYWEFDPVLVKPVEITVIDWQEIKE